MEITANASQAIDAGDNVLFTNVRTPGSCSIIHEDGSGIVTLRGLPNGQCRSRFRVTFSGNLKIDSSETISGVTLVSLAISQNGETVPTSTMTITVGDTTSTYNIGTQILIDVPTGCCQNISVKNISKDQITVDVMNANLIVERVA